MELDDLKTEWAALDRRFGPLEGWVSCHRKRSGIRSELRPLVVGQSIQVFAGILLAMVFGAFWSQYRHVPALLVSGLLLHFYAVAMIVAAVRNLVLVARVDESAPVLVLQRRIVRLRSWRIRDGRWFGALGCLLWVAIVVWGFGLLGVNIVAARPTFVACLVVAALVCLVAFIALSRLDRAPEGSAVQRASQRLDEIARFDAP